MSVDNKSVASTIVDSAIAEWFALVKTDAKLDRAEFLNRYPSVRSALQKFFEDYDAVHERLSAPTAPLPLVSTPDGGRVQSMLTEISVGDTAPEISSVTTTARFREMKQFNKGGLGNLYKAFDESLNRETAVKIANDRAASNPDLLTQFNVEAEITGRLDHPGVVPVYGMGEDWNGRPFYVMQLVKGQELAQSIREYHEFNKNRPKAADARTKLMDLLEYLVSACKTVAYAHDVGIIHCDIKPANIMVGKFGETFVLDWGLATTFERTQTFMKTEPHLRPRSVGDSSTNGPRGGTYGYISPEQLTESDPITPVSDVYSLGATLYEILTGKPPFDGHDSNVAEKIRAGKFVAPHLMVKSVSRRLEAICLKAMSLSPGDRYSTATLLAQDLTSWMRDDELLVVPDQWYHRVGRMAWRHRGIAVSLGISTILLTAVAIAAVRQNEIHRFEEAKQKQKTDHEKKLRENSEAQSKTVTTTLDTSLDTLEKICRPVANGELHNLSVLIPAMEEIKIFAEHYLETYDKSEENKTYMHLHTGRVYELRATVRRITSADAATVIEDYEKAEKTYEDEIRGNGAEAETLKWAQRLIDIRINKSRVQIQNGEYEKARELLQIAFKSANKLLRKHEDALAIRDLESDIAEIYHLQGEVDLNNNATGKKHSDALNAARSSLAKSISQLNKLIEEERADDPKTRSLNRALARSYGYRGDVYLELGNIKEAKRDYVQSDELRGKLLKVNNFDAETRFQFARGIGNFGLLERNYGDKDEAEKQLTQTQELLVSLAKEWPEVSDVQSDLAYYENSLAEVYIWQATSDEKKESEYLQKAEEVAKTAQARDPDDAHSQAWSLIIQATIAMLRKQNASAVDLGMQAEKRITNGKVVQNLRRRDTVTLAMAVAIQGEEQKERAYKLLRDAVDRGENTIERFERHRNAVFKSLNDHEGFNELCRELRKQLNNQ